MYIRPLLSALVPALLFALPGLALAQQADPQMEEQMQQQEPETTTYQDWEVACIETQGGERCRMQQTLQIQDEQAQGAYLQASLFRDGDSYIIEILLPLGVDLRPGILMQVDEDGEEIEAPYIACVEQGCVAGHELTDSQFNAMQGGRALTVGFWPLHGEQPLAFDVSLMGFTDASEHL